MNVLIWHVHGSWTTSFVAGSHTTILPIVPDRGPDGRGRAATWDWPDRAVERAPEQLADEHIDAIVIQRPVELALAERWLGGRRPGRDIPLVWLEHNAPQGRIADMIHPAHDRPDTTIVHVTRTNDLFWDCGSTPTRVIEHGVPDPGHRWVGDTVATAVVVNEPARRDRVVGADLLPRFGAAGHVDLFGIGVDHFAELAGRPSWLRTHEDVPQAELHGRMGRRRCYVHPFRWTSLGLSLIEAMMLGMPVVALATTEVPDAVPRNAGVVSNDVRRLVDAVAQLHHDHDAAAAMGAAARRHATERFALDRFLAEWDALLRDIAR